VPPSALPSSPSRVRFASVLRLVTTSYSRKLSLSTNRLGIRSLLPFASLEAAQSRARGAYVAVQNITANAGRAHIRVRDVPNPEQLVRDGGLGPLINSNDLTVAA